MSKKLIYLLLAVSLGVNVGVIATTLVHQTTRVPQGPPPGPGGREGRDPAPSRDPRNLVENHVRGITRHLDLDPDQQQAIRAVLERHASQLAEFQRDAASAGRRLAEAYAAAAFDPEQILQLTSEASTARSRLDSLSAVVLVAEAAVLSPEQRRKYAEIAPSIHSNPIRAPGRKGPPPRKGPR